MTLFCKKMHVMLIISGPRFICHGSDIFIRFQVYHTSTCHRIVFSISVLASSQSHFLVFIVTGELMLTTRPHIQLICLDWSRCWQYFRVAPSTVQILGKFKPKISSSNTCLLFATIKDLKQGKGNFSLWSSTDWTDPFEIKGESVLFFFLGGRWWFSPGHEP